ncbi:MAG: TlpA disulfide reductase family protein [Bacteroidota bacterium]
MRNFNLLWLVLFVGCTTDKPGEEVTSPLSYEAVIEINYMSAQDNQIGASADANRIIPEKRSKSASIVLKETKKYYLNIEIDRPVAGRLKLGKQVFKIMLHPGDTTSMTVANNDELQLSFSGQYQKINEYYLGKKKLLGYTNIREPFNNSVSSATTYNSLKSSTDSITGAALTFLETSHHKNQYPAWFINYESAEIKYVGAGFKTYMVNYNENFGAFKDQVPVDYFDYLKHIEINNQTAIQSSEYFRFLSNYYLRNLPKEYDQLSGFERASTVRAFFRDQSSTTLTGEAKVLYHQSLFASLLKYYSDSTEVRDLANAFNIEDLTPFSKMYGSKAKSDRTNLKVGDKVPDFFLTDELDSLVSIRDYRDKTIYINFWATWCKPCIKNIPELNAMVNEFSEKDDIVFLNICLKSEKKKWLNFLSSNQLTGVNLFAEGNWDKKLASYFNISGVPHYVILEKENTLRKNYANKAPAVKANLVEILHSETD